MTFPRSSSTCVSKRKPTPRCNFAFSDGRYCRMPRAADHPEYCIHHSREDRQLLETERIGELLAATPSGEFLTATDVNSVLGKLYTAIALNRIPHRNAALMAYVGQLLLHSTSAIKDEIMNAKGYTTWCKVSRKALTEKLPQPPPTKSALPVNLESTWSPNAPTKLPKRMTKKRKKLSSRRITRGTLLKKPRKNMK